MDRYQVTDPKGLSLGRRKTAEGWQKQIVKQGELLPAGIEGSRLKAWLRFGQVKKVEEPAAKPAADSKPGGEPKPSTAKK